MRIKTLILICLFLLILSGCGDEQVEESSAVLDLHPISDSTVWDNITIEAITPVTAFEINDDALKIFPYNNNDKHITMRKIVISRNGFWNTVETIYDGSDNLHVTSDYVLITMSNHCTYGYVPIDDEWAYIVSTESLPSSYVEAFLRMLCSTNI